MVWLEVLEAVEESSLCLLTPRLGVPDTNTVVPVTLWPGIDWYCEEKIFVLHVNRSVQTQELTITIPN